MSERYKELADLYHICELTLSARPPHEAYPELLDAIAEVLSCPIVAVECLDRRGQPSLVTVAARGLPPSNAGPLEVPLDGTPSGEAIRTGKPVVETDPGDPPEHTHPALASLSLRTYAAFPLASADGITGALLVASTAPAPSPERLERRGARVATIVAAYVERLAAEEALRDNARRYQTLATKLQHLNQELETFAVSVSHDLRAPLRTMQGFAHALLDRCGDTLTAEGRDFASRIISAGRDSEQLISGLLAYSRVSLAEVGLGPVSLRSVVETAREQLRADIEVSRARLDLCGPLPTVLGNSTILGQVVANLLSNAIKFVPDDRTPEVVVRAEEVGDRVRLWVEDNGIGVPHGEEALIFKTFERLPSGHGKPGTGVGLAIVRRGMERLGGEAGLQASDNGGCAFWIDLRKDRRGP
ncbi:MAG TPA: ATP-binding protein [Longimicrobiales bacterium]|nr:ATP-binding protein [Longimicrobiales bacterium]